jgi:hypothetical protein
MDNWHVSKNQTTEGPITEENLINRIRKGELKKGSLVWKKGMKTWDPIEIHFAYQLTEVQGEIIQESRSKNPTIPSITAIQRIPETSNYDSVDNNAPPISAISGYRPLVKYVGAVVLLFVLFIVANSHSGNLNDPLVFWVVWCGTLYAAIISAIFLIYKSWLVAQKRTIQTKGSSGGILKLACIFIGMALLVFGLVYIPQASLIYRVSQARKAFDKYTMEVDVAQNAIIIDGIIGPSFAERLKRNLDIHAGIDKIIITSAGGLVDQGFKAARAIERQNNITVIARSMCNSSCLIVLMAGNKRLADWDMKLGFHATSFITHVDSEYRGLAELSDEADRYLTKRGVPQEIINHAFAKGAKELELVPAVTLADLHVLTGLLDDNKYVPTDIAKWRIVEKVLDSLKDRNILGFSQVLKAIRETAPDVVNSQADNLYKAYKGADVTQMRVAVKAIISAVMPYAVQAADGRDLYRYTMNNLKQIAYLSSMEDWDTCAHYVDGQISSEINVMSQSALQDEFDSLEKLIRSAGAKNWKRQPIPKWAEQRGGSLVQKTVFDSLKARIDLDKLDTNSRAKCVRTYTLIKLITDEGIDHAPPILRWLELQGELP